MKRGGCRFWRRRGGGGLPTSYCWRMATDCTRKMLGQDNHAHLLTQRPIKNVLVAKKVGKVLWGDMISYTIPRVVQGIRAKRVLLFASFLGCCFFFSGEIIYGLVVFCGRNGRTVATASMRAMAALGTLPPWLLPILSTTTHAQLFSKSFFFCCLHYLYLCRCRNGAVLNVLACSLLRHTYLI